MCMCADGHIPPSCRLITVIILCFFTLWVLTLLGIVFFYDEYAVGGVSFADACPTFAACFG